MRRPLFLARAPYRRRRLRDAARLLPVLGMLLLLLLPLLWTPGSEVRLGAGDVAYFFLVWFGLIALAAAIAPGLSPGEGDEEED